MTSYSLQIIKLTKALNDKFVIGELSLTLSKNKRVALLGLNGAGKSSFIRLLVGESKPDGGEILFSNNLKTWHPQDLAFKKLLGYQADTMLSITEMTGREYLNLCGNLKELSSTENRASLERVVQQWNIGALLDQKMANLSKGNLQKLSIAQVFMADPKWLFFDEPCQSLDPLEQDRFNQNIKNLNDIELCLFSTHNVNHALEVADEIILFHQARIGYYFKSRRQNDYLLVCTKSDPEFFPELKLLALKLNIEINRYSEQLYQVRGLNSEQLEQFEQCLQKTQYPIDFCLQESQAVMPLFRLFASGEIHSTGSDLQGDEK